jgi:hypothetical protein
VKLFGIFAILISFLLVQGCTSNSQDAAGRKSEVTNPPAATETAVVSSAPPIAARAVPAANGGATLPANAPYRQPNGTAVQQNINPAPFLVAAGAGQGAGPSSGASQITSGKLTSRADGTMSGPSDQPAAGTGWGTQGPQPNPAATSSKPATQSSQKTPK